MPSEVKRRGSRKTVNAANLAALGPERLAAVLMAAAEDDPALKRRLRMELAGEAGPEHLSAEIAKRLAAVEARRSRVHWRKYKAFVRELELLRGMIAGPLAEGDAAAALDLLWRYLELSRTVFGHTEDARGEVAAAFAAAADALGPLAARARPAPDRLATRLAELLAHDEEQLFLDLAGSVVADLDPAAVEQVRLALAQAQAARRRPSPVLRAALQQIADRQGDADAYAATFAAAEARQPWAGAEIARRLLAGGRVEEALAALARSAPPSGGQAALPGAREWEEVYLEALEADGQQELAQEVRWSAFERRLDAERLRAYLRRLPDFDDLEAEERAFEHARRFPRFVQALAFFTAWPAAGEAAALVLDRAPEIPADQPLALEAAVRLLEARHPLAASLLLRTTVADTLRWGRTEQAAEAKRQLAELGELAAQVGDWGAFETYDAFLTRLARIRRI